VLKNTEGDIVDKYRCSGGKPIKVKYKCFDTAILGKIKPRNQRQELFFDLLNSKIKVVSVSGEAGVGKTFVAMCYALQEVKLGHYEKIVVIRNNVALLNVPALGFLPGSALDKMKDSCAFISDIIGSYLFDSFLDQNKIEIVYLGTMRSRSLNNSIILCNESQNLSTDLVKMVVSRVGTNSKLIFDSDLSQIDKKVFEKDNGMIAMNESLAGNPLFGAVELEGVERSEVAKLAALIK